jgi:hypothetical protein
VLGLLRVAALARAEFTFRSFTMAKKAKKKPKKKAAKKTTKKKA